MPSIIFFYLTLNLFEQIMTMYFCFEFNKELIAQLMLKIIKYFIRLKN